MAQKAPRAPMDRRTTYQAGGARSTGSGSVVTTQGGGSTVTINPGKERGPRAAPRDYLDDYGTGEDPGEAEDRHYRARPAPGADEDQDDDGGRGRGGDRRGGRGAGAGKIYQRLETPSGWLVALFVYPLAVNLLKGGPGLMWAWVKAKFINQPAAGAHHVAGNGPGPNQGG